MKLATKITLPTLALFVLLFVVFGYFFYELRLQEIFLQNMSAEVEATNIFSNQLNELQGGLEKALLSYQFDQSQATLDQIYGNQIEIAQTVDELALVTGPGTGATLLRSYAQAREDSLPLEDALVLATQQSNRNGDTTDTNVHLLLNQNVDTAFTKWNIQHAKVSALLQDLVTFNLQKFNRGVNSLEEKRDAFLSFLIVMALISFAVVLFSFAIARLTIAPIRDLREGIDIVEKGNLEHRVGTKANDEIGHLSRAFDKMTNSIKESQADIAEKVKLQTEQITAGQGKLESALQEAELLNKSMIGRELKMIGLKKKISELEKEVAALKHT